MTEDISRTTVRLERGLDAFSRLSPDERMRVFIRVLCELVAYGETPADARTPGEGAPELLAS